MVTVTKLHSADESYLRIKHARIDTGKETDQIVRNTSRVRVKSSSEHDYDRRRSVPLRSIISTNTAIDSGRIR